MNKPESRDQISRLFDELAQAVLHHKEEAREVLEEAERSPEEVRRRGQDFIQKMKGKAKLAQAEKKKSKINQLRDKLKDYVDRKVEGDPKKVLSEMMAKLSGETPQFHFRKIEELSEEDALDMLDEVELLRLLEQQEEEDEGED